MSGEGGERGRPFGFLATAMKAYPVAKRALVAEGMKAEEVEALPVLQVILLDAHRLYRKFSDATFQWISEPYYRAGPALSKVKKEMAEVCTAGRGVPILDLLPAATSSSRRRPGWSRASRALRCIEAVRLHAAANKGQLPAKLSDITAVPVPDDPASGRPFEYRPDGNRFVLSEGKLANDRPAACRCRCGMRSRCSARIGSQTYQPGVRATGSVKHPSLALRAGMLLQENPNADRYITNNPRPVAHAGGRHEVRCRGRGQAPRAVPRRRNRRRRPR